MSLIAQWNEYVKSVAPKIVVANNIVNRGFGEKTMVSCYF